MEELAQVTVQEPGLVGAPSGTAHRPRGSSRQERTTCYYRGFKYTRAWTSSRTIAYRCSRFRTGCRGSLKFTIATMGFSAGRSHTCRDFTPSSGRVQDVSVEMMNRTDALAIEQVARPARQIWEALRDEFYGTDNGNVVRGLSEMQVQRRIYRARHQHFSGDVHGAIEIPPLSLALDEAVSFFQFHYVTTNNENLNKPTRLLGWAHPALLNLLRYHGITLFVDGTFHCVPRGYKQCVIFMVHDRATGIFVPVYYVLSTSRTGDSYWDMMHFVLQGTDQQLEPAEIVCDFETGLLNAVNTQFPNAIIVGCLFHLKQALRRAMKRFAIPEEECSIAMAGGVLDMLTVIEHDLIELGTKWVKREIRQRCSTAGIAYSKAKWRGFWDYFRRTWMEQYDVEVWNVAGLDNELVARTNNPLEWFNRELNSRFPSPRPSMATFVGVIKTLSSEYVRRLADVPRGRVRRATRERIDLPVPVEIPKDIADDSDDDESVAVELPSDCSSDEEAPEGDYSSTGLSL